MMMLKDRICRNVTTPEYLTVDPFITADGNLQYPEYIAIEFQEPENIGVPLKFFSWLR